MHWKSLLAKRGKIISYERHLYANFSCEWLCSALAFNHTLLTLSQRRQFILPWTLLLVYTPSSGLLLQYVVTTFIGLLSQKAGWESSLLTHQSSLLRVSSPDCQEHQMNWICRNPHSSPPAQGSPMLLYTDYTFLPAPSEWLTHCSLMQSAISLSLTSHYIPHRQLLLPKAVPRAGITLSPGQPALPSYRTAEASMSPCPQPASWIPRCKLEQQHINCRGAQLHVVYFRMRQFSWEQLFTLPVTSITAVWTEDVLSLTYLLYLAYTLHFISIFHIKKIIGNEGLQYSRKSLTKQQQKRGWSCIKWS